MNAGRLLRIEGNMNATYDNTFAKISKNIFSLCHYELLSVYWQKWQYYQYRITRGLNTFWSHCMYAMRCMLFALNIPIILRKKIMRMYWLTPVLLIRYYCQWWVYVWYVIVFEVCCQMMTPVGVLPRAPKWSEMALTKDIELLENVSVTYRFLFCFWFCLLLCFSIVTSFCLV